MACARAALSCFESDDCLAGWFHGSIGREEGEHILTTVEPGGYLIRFSEAKPKSLTLSYKGRSGSCSIKNVMIFNLGTCYSLSNGSGSSSGGVSPTKEGIISPRDALRQGIGHHHNHHSPLNGGSSTSSDQSSQRSSRSAKKDVETFATISEFLNRHTSKMKFSVVSDLSRMCRDEVETERLNAAVALPRAELSVLNSSVSGSEGNGGGDDDVVDEDDCVQGSDWREIRPTELIMPSLEGAPSEVENNLYSTFVEPLPNHQERPLTAKSPSQMWGHDVNNIEEQQQSMMISPAFGDAGEVGDAYGSFESDFQVSTPSKLVPKEAHPPSHTTAETEAFTEIESYLHSANSALEQNDLEVTSLLIRSLRLLTDAPSFKQSGGGQMAKELKERVSILEESYERACDGGVKPKLTKAFLESVKGMANKGDGAAALEKMPKEMISADDGSGLALKMHALRLRGDLIMMQKFVNLEEAMQSYCEARDIATKLLDDEEEIFGIALGLYRAESTSESTPESTSSSHTLKILQQIHAALCDVAERQRNFGDMIENNALAIGTTFSLASRTTLLEKLRASDEVEVLNELEKHEGEVREEAMSSGIRCFTRSKELQGGEKISCLQESVSHLNRAITASRLCGDWTLEARATGNLGTVMNHLSQAGIAPKSSVFHLMAQSLCIFRLAETASPGIRNNYSNPERTILHNLVLHLEGSEKYRLAKRFCAVQLEIQISRDNIKQVKKRLDGLNAKLFQPKGTPPRKISNKT